jgi:hypothetical protein
MAVDGMKPSPLSYKSVLPHLHFTLRDIRYLIGTKHFFKEETKTFQMKLYLLRFHFNATNSQLDVLHNPILQTVLLVWEKASRGRSILP